MRARAFKVVTELQFTIETMLRAAADPVTHKRHIPYQMLIARNVKIRDLYISLFVVISCSGVDLTIDANSQSAVASQLRRHVHDVIMAGDGPSVLLTSEHVIPVLVEHKILASTLRACDSVSTQKWNGCSERLTENFTQISPIKRVGCRCGSTLARKASGIQVRCHAFSLREGSA